MQAAPVRDVPAARDDALTACHIGQDPWKLLLVLEIRVVDVEDRRDRPEGLRHIVWMARHLDEDDVGPEAPRQSFSLRQRQTFVADDRRPAMLGQIVADIIGPEQG